MRKFVSKKPITNGQMNALEKEFAESYPRSFLTGFLAGGDNSTEGSVGWTVVLRWDNPYTHRTLNRSEDAMSLIIDETYTKGDCGPFFEKLEEKGFKLVEE